jgi:hypothetical protein
MASVHHAQCGSNSANFWGLTLNFPAGLPILRIAGPKGDG